MFPSICQASVIEQPIKQFESKLNIISPPEIRAAIKVHDGRKHIGYGLGYRRPSTDLLSLSEWKSYEKDRVRVKMIFNFKLYCSQYIFL